MDKNTYLKIIPNFLIVHDLYNVYICLKNIYILKEMTKSKKKENEYKNNCNCYHFDISRWKDLNILIINMD